MARVPDIAAAVEHAEGEHDYFAHLLAVHDALVGIGRIRAAG